MEISVTLSLRDIPGGLLINMNKSLNLITKYLRNINIDFTHHP